MALWIGLGLEAIARSLPSRFGPVALTVALLPGLLAATHWRAMDQSQNHLGEQFVASVFSRLPRDAVILSYWDAVQPLGYAHCVVGWRPDILVLSPFDRDYQGCDTYVDLHVLVGGPRPVYAFMLFRSNVDALARDFRLTEVASIPAPFGERKAEFMTPLYLVVRKGP